jgi:hypothetical protein
MCSTPELPLAIGTPAPPPRFDKFRPCRAARCCRAEELFAASAFRKAESMPLGGSPYGYAKADGFKECEALANGCSVYFVPVDISSYKVTDENCGGKLLATIDVTGGGGNTLEADKGPKVAVVPANLKAAESETWSGWDQTTEIEVALSAALFLSLLA